jgi:hypothetical protein
MWPRDICDSGVVHEQIFFTTHNHFLTRHVNINDVPPVTATKIEASSLSDSDQLDSLNSSSWSTVSVDNRSWTKLDTVS